MRRNRQISQNQVRMEITKSTYIDKLQRLKLISSTTRNNLIDRAIFTVQDLEQFIDHRGKISIRGLSTRSICELQAVCDKVFNSSSESSEKKPRKLVRILSNEEKSTISELQDLFASTYLGGCTIDKDTSNSKALRAEDPSRIKARNDRKYKPGTSEGRQIFHEYCSRYLGFLKNNERLPDALRGSNEKELTDWYGYVTLEKDEYDDLVKSLIDSLVIITKTYQ